MCTKNENLCKENYSELTEHMVIVLLGGDLFLPEQQKFLFPCTYTSLKLNFSVMRVKTLIKMASYVFSKKLDTKELCWFQ